MVSEKEPGYIDELKNIEAERINTVSENAAWEEIEFTVDGGATQTVALDIMPTPIPIIPGPATRIEMKYIAANGATIPNGGETDFMRSPSKAARRHWSLNL